jgi:hypothetical protein
LRRSFFVFIIAIGFYTAAVMMQDEHPVNATPEIKSTASESTPVSPAPDIANRNPSQTL